jgi:hypothetical protein
MVFNSPSIRRAMPCGILASPLAADLAKRSANRRDRLSMSHFAVQYCLTSPIDRASGARWCIVTPTMQNSSAVAAKDQTVRRKAVSSQ